MVTSVRPSPVYCNVVNSDCLITYASLCVTCRELLWNWSHAVRRQFVDRLHGAELLTFTLLTDEATNSYVYCFSHISGVEYRYLCVHLVKAAYKSECCSLANYWLCDLMNLFQHLHNFCCMYCPVLLHASINYFSSISKSLSHPLSWDNVIMLSWGICFLMSVVCPKS